MLCYGDRSTTCGGYKKNAVYSVGLFNATTTTKISDLTENGELNQNTANTLQEKYTLPGLEFDTLTTTPLTHTSIEFISETQNPIINNTITNEFSSSFSSQITTAYSFNSSHGSTTKSPTSITASTRNSTQKFNSTIIYYDEINSSTRGQNSTLIRQTTNPTQRFTSIKCMYIL